MSPIDRAEQKAVIPSTLLSSLNKSFLDNHDRIALASGDQQMTYSDARERSDRLKESLIARGCKPGIKVAIVVGHSMAMVTSILAVLKAGGAFVPLDPRVPAARLALIVQDSETRLCITDKANLSLAQSLGLECIDANNQTASAASHTAPKVNASDLAYILYTSGSTGRPKGVGITHANLMSYAAWASETYFPNMQDRIALYSTLTFDFTMTSIFPPLLAGASISIFDGITDPFVIREIAADIKTNILKITPAYLRLLSELPMDLSHLTRVIVGGENLNVNLAAKVQPMLADGAVIINEYGPTEATVGCIVHSFDPRQDKKGSVPIGRPIPDVKAKIENEQGEVLEGEGAGELIIAGPNIAPGYINLPEKTAKVFSEHSSPAGTRSYRTGDLVRRREDGILEFLGRKDDQVKIRGNRVELAEVTAAILDIVTIKSAFVFAISEHDTHILAAAVVSNKSDLDIVDLKRALAQVLPDYMVPSVIRTVAELPLSQNQKVDREKLLTLIGKKEK
ncbi:MAG: amino acid adenylation domain-containing protein [Cohaesibacter sp.]|nr:amino acid adenylation domain-containing protein [Cohaesibacter sp.]